MSTYQMSSSSWVTGAIQSEKRYSSDQLWKNEPSLEQIQLDRLKRITFLPKHGKGNSAANALAERLDFCSRRHPCLSGSCPACGRLFQRAWVRASKSAVKSMRDDDAELVAVSLIFPHIRIPKGRLDELDIINFKRRLKLRLRTAGINAAIGAIDFSLNEDRHGRYRSFWCPHAYIITSTTDRRKLSMKLTAFKPTPEIPRPTKITEFENSARRRSYAMKMQFKRRITYDDCRPLENGKIRHFRNTSNDRLRADELVELLILLDDIGFTGRAIFVGIKPMIKGRRLYFRRMTTSRKDGQS